MLRSTRSLAALHRAVRALRHALGMMIQSDKDTVPCLHPDFVALSASGSAPDNTSPHPKHLVQSIAVGGFEIPPHEPQRGIGRHVQIDGRSNPQ